MLTSQSVFLATTMAVSAGTMILFHLFRGKSMFLSKIQDSNSHENRALRSCLSSGCKKMDRQQQTKKKRVKFAEDDIKDSTSSRINDGKSSPKTERNSFESGNGILELKKMPANRVALYSGILKERVQRMEYSY